MSRDELAVIGGSGADRVIVANQPSLTRLGPTPTPFGLSAPLYRARLGEVRFLFLPRHGESGREVAAPWVNYRANVYALKEQGVSRILAWSGAAALDAALQPGQYVLPTDLIDDTRGRESSFLKGTGLGGLRPQPVFCPELREAAELALDRLRLGYRRQGIYVCTQGPRLETPAEVRRLRSWGAHLVGMTLAPEAFLARELEMCYLPICCVAGIAEGITDRPARAGQALDGLTEQAERDTVEAAAARLLEVAAQVARAVRVERSCPCALAMERYRREGRIQEDWHTWIGKP